MTKILVTGIAGFIGSNLGEHLIKNNYTVFGIDNFDPFYDRSIKEDNISGFRDKNNFHLFEVNLLNKEGLKNIFETNKVDVVIHLAAKTGVRPSLIDPLGYYNTNVIGTLNLLEVMREYGCKKMIFASSSSVYGNNKKVPFSEDDNVDNPISPYAATKKAGELLCHTYHHLYGFDIFCLRFFTVYGPRQRPEMAIHNFVRAISEKQSITLFGDGTTKRDYTYIDDILSGIISAIERVKGYEIINLGESQTIALIDIVQSIEKYVGKEAIIQWEPEQPGDVQLTNADIRKAKTLLGYSPSTNIEEGISKFVRWFNSRR